MTKTEKQQITEIWAELENVVAILDPTLSLKNFNLGLLDGKEFVGVKDLIALLRIQARVLCRQVSF